MKAHEVAAVEANLVKQHHEQSACLKAYYISADMASLLKQNTDKISRAYYIKLTLI